MATLPRFAPEPELHWRPLREGDLAYVAALEAQIHAAPWSLGNFRDALSAGYLAWVGERENRIVAYGILMLGVGEAQILNVSVVPDARLLKEIETRGVIVTAPGDEPGVDFISRFFAPAVGVDEDPVTGSIHAGLAPFWAGRLGKSNLLALQASRRSGVLHCRVEGERVYVSGSAVQYLEGTIDIPL